MALLEWIVLGVNIKFISRQTLARYVRDFKIGKCVCFFPLVVLFVGSFPSTFFYHKVVGFDFGEEGWKQKEGKKPWLLGDIQPLLKSGRRQINVIWLRSKRGHEWGRNRHWVNVPLYLNGLSAVGFFKRGFTNFPTRDTLWNQCHTIKGWQKSEQDKTSSVTLCQFLKWFGFQRQMLYNDCYNY